MHDLRRQLLGQRLAATGTLKAPPLFAATGTLIAPPLFAAAPMSTGTDVSARRMKLGACEVTTILDGFIELPPTALQGDPELIKRAMEAGGLGVAPIRTAVNCFLVNTGPKLVMIDCGGAKMLGPNAGRMPQAMVQLGIDPRWLTRSASRTCRATI